jgi:5'(3')-deoxyribonucleotidase
MSYKLLLDMDGVLDDFVGGASKAHSRTSPYEDDQGHGVFDMEKLWGISTNDFWAKCQGYNFWFWMEKTKEADEIVNLATAYFGVDNIAILTSPSDPDRECVEAKRDWIKKYYPQFSKRIIFGSAKEFLAGPERVLIDDRDRNVEDFRAAGGATVLVPRPWNKENDRSGKVLEVVKLGLAVIMGVSNDIK